MKIALVSVTRQGNYLAEKIKNSLCADFYCKDNVSEFNIMKISKTLMEEYEGIIYVSSTGIAVRAISPFLKGKDKDPAVLVIDCTGKYVISLLSGHIGGANELTYRIAKIIGAEPIITTATDNLGIKAPDIIAVENDLVIDDLKSAKEIATLLVEGKRVGFIDFDDILAVPCGYVKDLQDVKGIVYITNKNDSIYSFRTHFSSIKRLIHGQLIVYRKQYSMKIKFKKVENITKFNGMNIFYKLKTLKLIRKNIVLGIGCRKNYDSDQLRDKVLQILKENNIEYRAVKAICTVEVKKDEKAILDLVNCFQCEFKIYTLDEIKTIQHKYKGSDFVEKSIGVRAVCEPCVELYGAELITDKIPYQGMTLCIGEKKKE